MQPTMTPRAHYSLPPHVRNAWSLAVENSHAAKHSTDEVRDSLYQSKARAVSYAIRHAGEHCIVSDWDLLDSGIIGIQLLGTRGLHVRVCRLDNEARAWVEQKRSDREGKSVRIFSRTRLALSKRRQRKLGELRKSTLALSRERMTAVRHDLTQVTPYTPPWAQIAAQANEAIEVHQFIEAQPEAWWHDQGSLYPQDILKTTAVQLGAREELGVQDTPRPLQVAA